MTPTKIFDFSSAYSQLILMVFVPITALAGVGAYLVDTETTKAIESEQRTLATAALIRYEPVVKQMLPQMLGNQSSAQSSAQLAIQGVNKASDQSIGDASESQTLSQMQSSLSQALNSMNNNQHIQQVAVLDEQGKVIASSHGYEAGDWGDSWSQFRVQVQSQAQMQFISGIHTATGTAYGHLLGEHSGQRYWLVVDMDNEPLQISRLQVRMVLVSIGLFTLLILLLSLNVYAKRWIAPIYNLRLHLQQITPENMYHPVNNESSGELNLLQQDLVKTLRRLYAEFQELKNHADQTQDDLRDALDEMEIQNIFIRESRDHAVSSSQAKSAFLANISHELRTPLNSIDGFINLLARHGNLTAEQDLYVQTIRKSSAHLLALINDVLDFSKIEAGKLVLDTHEFNLYAAIYDVMDMLSPLAAEKGLRMAVLYYNDVPNTIIGDALRVKQVLTNLVGNAIKFTDVGEVVVRVGIDEVIEDATVVTRASEHSDDKSSTQAAREMIHIAVQDTGHGISETAKAQLFKSFSQGDPSITRQYGGTGLGLVISRQLTRLMGGQVGFYNNAQGDMEGQIGQIGLSDTLITSGSTHTTADTKATGKTKPGIKTGSTFWFTIPANVEIEALADGNLDDEIAAEFGKTATYEDAADVITLPKLRPFRKLAGTGAESVDDDSFAVLVWIDHPASLQVFMAAMRPLNVEVTQAKSLVGALEHLKEKGNRWDWVLIDGGEGEAEADSVALLKQIRLHYQGRLAIYGYQIALDATLLERYKASSLYQPLDKRQLYALLDAHNTHLTTVTPPLMWQGIRVLAVDDHLPNLLVLDALLGELGIEVITANNGYEAVDIVSKYLLSTVDEHGGDAVDSDIGNSSNSSTAHDVNSSIANKGKGSQRSQASSKARKIDLIFMDIQMPRMSGDEAAIQIRQLEADLTSQEGIEQPHIPMIALTAHGLSDEKDKLIAAGFDDYVGKPISRPQLLQILQRWLGKGGHLPPHILEQSATVSPTSEPLKTEKMEGSDSQQQNALDSLLDDRLRNPLGSPLDSSLDKRLDSYFNQSQATSRDNKGHDNGDNDQAINPESGSDLSVVDWKDALIRSANKPDLAKQLLTMMQDTIADELHDLAGAWQNHDREQLAQIAHRILGASRYAGVPQIRQASQDFEDKCLLNVQHVVPAQFAMLSPYYTKLVDSLERLQHIDLDAEIRQQMALAGDKTPSENDMTWKMI